MTVAVRLRDGSWYGTNTDAGRFGQRVTVGTVRDGFGIGYPCPVVGSGDGFGSVDDARTVAVIGGRLCRLWTHVYASTTGPARSRADGLVGRFGRDRAAAVRYLHAVGASVPADD